MKKQIKAQKKAVASNLNDKTRDNILFPAMNLLHNPQVCMLYLPSIRSAVYYSFLVFTEVLTATSFFCRDAPTRLVRGIMGVVRRF